MGGHTFWPFSMNNTSFKKIFHDHVNALKTRHVFSAEFKSVKNLYFLELFFLRARSKRWLSYPFVSGISWIAFTVKYFFEKSVIQKIWPKMWPPNFHLILNFNLLVNRNALFCSSVFLFFRVLVV